MPITDQVATAPCTDPIQLHATITQAYDCLSIKLLLFCDPKRTSGVIPDDRLQVGLVETQ